MKTVFFRKKAFILAGILSIATVISGIFYAHALIGAVEVNVGESFYFLISEEENVALRPKKYISMAGRDM